MLSKKDALKLAPNTRTAECLTKALSVKPSSFQNGFFICPECGREIPDGGLKFFPDGGFKHFKPPACYGDPISILKLKGSSFVEAVSFLLGMFEDGEIKVDVENASFELNKKLGFKAVPDYELYQSILTYGVNTGGVQRAIDFYGQWGISPAAVKHSGAVHIQDFDRFTSGALKKYGSERLVMSGLFLPATESRPLKPLVSVDYPVIEPHIDPQGVVRYMQFRASAKQYQRYLDHKAGLRDYKGSQKFMSLRGTPRDDQVGTGLNRLVGSPQDVEIYVV